MAGTVRYLYRDVEFEWEEVRDAIIGRTENQSLLFVVHVIRHEETIRIISARKATRQESRRYEQS